MDAQTLHIDFIVPQGWHEMTDAQLRYLYNLIALELSSEEIAVTCLLHWSGTMVIGLQPDGAYLLQQGMTNRASRKHGELAQPMLRHSRLTGKATLFEVKPLAIAEHIKEIDWLGQLPTYPVRLSAIRTSRASELKRGFIQRLLNAAGIGWQLCRLLLPGLDALRNNRVIARLHKKVGHDPIVRCRSIYNQNMDHN